MTFIGYPDLTATSESGLFRIEIRGTVADDFFRDQSGFVYRLYRSGQLVWELPERRERVDEDADALSDFPHEAWVNDEGWVVVRSHHWFGADIAVLSPEGRIVLRREFRRCDDEFPPGFLDGEPEHFMGESSAGPFWARCSIAYFFKHDGRSLWVIRTWWGRRVVVDLAKGEFLSHLQIAGIPLDDPERAFVLRLLVDNIDRLEARAQGHRSEEAEDEFWSIGCRVSTAAYHAGMLRSLDSIPFLRRLETLDTDGSSAYGPVSWAVLHELPFRHVAKTSLLRLGQVPSWRAHYRFELSDDSADDDSADDDDEKDDEISDDAWFDIAETPEARSLDLIQVGLTQREILRRIGAPDFLERREWEYDFVLKDRSFTVRLHWTESDGDGVAATQERLSPNDDSPPLLKFEIIEPQWLSITDRDYSLTR